MAEAKEEKKALKVKKKKWYGVFAPKLLKETLLGETLVADPMLMIGKTLTVNLMVLTDDIKKQNINMKFLVNNVQGDRALTEIIGYEVIPAYIKRLTRKGKKKVDMSFVCETSDNTQIRIKPLFLIKSMTKSSTESALRKQTLDFLTKTIKKTAYDDLVSSLISHKLQGLLRDNLKKIYPLGVCEIRQMILEGEKKAEEIKEKEPKEVKGKVEEKNKELKTEEEKDKAAEAR